MSEPVEAATEHAPLHVVFGAGQIGGALARDLAARGLRVRVVRRAAKPVGEGIEVRAGDARDAAFVAGAVAGAATLYHCVNPAYTVRAWEAVHPPVAEALIAGALAADARLVVLGNLYGYGPHDGPLTETLPMAPAGGKAAVRARMAERLLAAARDDGLRCVIGRAGDFFGPGAAQALFSMDAVRGLAQGRRPHVLGDPTAPHAFGYIPDVVAALAALGLAEADVEGQVFHLPALHVSQAELVARLGAALGVEVRPRRARGGLVRLLGPFVPFFGELRETLYQWERPFRVDDAKFRARFPGLGTPLAQAVEETARAARTP